MLILLLFYFFISQFNCKTYKVEDHNISKDQAELTFGSKVAGTSLFDKVHPKIESVNVVLVWEQK